MAGDTAVARAVAFAATVAFGVGALFGARFGRGGERAPAPTERAEKTREAAAGATATATPRDDAPSARPSPSATRRPKPAPRQRSETVAAPIGVVHSCFSRRNGTPRQGGDLVPSARCVFFLDGGLPRDLLSGLDRYSHCWVLYEFHANTNRRDVVSDRVVTENTSRTTRNGGAVKGKARVPRLDGAPVGALATRTPHRPTPIGLSLGSIVRVDTDTGAITLGGCDLVDGTPVLDIKPYVPFCDAVRDAVAPAWVRRGGTREDEDGRDAPKVRGEKDEKHDRRSTDERRVTLDEPLEIAAVRFDASAETAVAAAYLRSVKARRARRLAGLTAAELARVGKRTSKPNARRTNRTNDDGTVPTNGASDEKTRSGVVVSAEEMKRVKREAKARRQAGLAFPDALYDSGESFVSFVKEVLSLDVRAARERVGVKKKFETYRVVLCDVEVEYAVLEEPGVGRVVVVRGGTETAPLAKPGVTADRRPEKKQTRYE